MELVGARCYLEELRKTNKTTPSVANVPAEIGNALNLLGRMYVNGIKGVSLMAVISRAINSR